MWTRLTSLLGSGTGHRSTDTGAAPSPRGSKYSSATNADADNAQPLTCFVHFIFTEDLNSDVPVTVANALSREFGFGMDAVRCDAAADLRRALAWTPALQQIHDDKRNLDEDGEQDDGLDVLQQRRFALTALHADGVFVHRWCLRYVQDALFMHHVLLAHKSLMSDLLPALRHVDDFTVPTTHSSPPSSASASSGRGIVMQVGVVAVLHCTSPRAFPRPSDSLVVLENPAYSDPDGDDEERGGRGSSSVGYIVISLQELRDPVAVAGLYDTLRSKALAFAGSLSSGLGTASIELDRSPSKSTEMQSLPPSCLSNWELRRLRSEQLTLLETVAQNLGKLTESRQYGKLNAGSGRFFEEIGRHPAAMRTLRNLGFTSLDDNLVLSIGDMNDDGSGIRSNDRMRFLHCIDALLAARSK